MRRFLTGLLLFTVVLVQPACKAKEKKEVGPPAIDKLTSPVIVCITAKAPDVTPVTVKANGKQDVLWKSHDSAYMLRFLDTEWNFTETADGEETVGGQKYYMIAVPAKGTSKPFTLKDALAPGATDEHHYRIDYDPMVSPPDPPNGPVVVGEG